MVKLKLSNRKRLLLAGEFAALGAASVILLVFLASSLDGILIQGGQGAAVITSVLVDLANTDRGSNHVGDLAVNPTLTAIAQAKADDMAAKGYFAHVTPEGHDPWYWFALGGYKFTYAGENLAVDFSDSADVERAWMNSPTHRANLLNGHFTQIGIATAVGSYNGHQTTFVVQEFGTPAHAKDAPVAASSVPTTPTEIAIATTEIQPVAVATAPAKPKPVAISAVPAPKTVTTTTTPTANLPEAVLGTSATGLASPEPTAVDKLGLTPLWNVFAASPKTTLRYAYYLFGLLILLAVVIETGIEIKRHHMKHVALAVALIALMGGLFFAADSVVFTNQVTVDSGGAVTGT